MTRDSHPVDNPDASKTGPALTPQPQLMAEIGAFVYFPLEDPVCCQTSPAVAGICPGSVSALHGPCCSLGRSRAPTLPKNRPVAPLWGDRTPPPVALLSALLEGGESLPIHRATCQVRDLNRMLNRKGRGCCWDLVRSGLSVGEGQV